MAVFVQKTVEEWFEILKAIIHSEPELADLTIERTTDYGAEVYAIATALAHGDVQRAVILADAHPHLASRFGLMLRADELGLTYDANTSTEQLRDIVSLAERTNVGTFEWYEEIIPLMYPNDVTDATVETGVRGPGSVRIAIFRNGGPVSQEVLDEVQDLFNGETIRLTTDRVYIITNEYLGV